jgi:outer membrane protein assembly factor BamD (BamD/ComL family)
LAYLREPALYYRALFDAELSRQDQWSVPEEKQVDMSARKPAEMAVREFEDFLREYPESVFAGNARGDLREAMSFLRRRSH